MTPRTSTYLVRDHIGQTVMVRAKTRREAIVRVALSSIWKSEQAVEMVNYWSAQIVKEDCNDRRG